MRSTILPPIVFPEILNESRFSLCSSYTFIRFTRSAGGGGGVGGESLKSFFKSAVDALLLVSKIFLYSYGRIKNHHIKNAPTAVTTNITDNTAITIIITKSLISVTADPSAS